MDLGVRKLVKILDVLGCRLPGLCDILLSTRILLLQALQLDLHPIMQPWQVSEVNVKMPDQMQQVVCKQTTWQLPQSSASTALLLRAKMQ